MIDDPSSSAGKRQVKIDQRWLGMLIAEFLLTIVRGIISGGITFACLVLLSPFYAFGKAVSEGALAICGLSAGLIGGFCGGKPRRVAWLFPGLGAILAQSWLLKEPEQAPMLLMSLFIGQYLGASLWYLLGRLRRSARQEPSH